MSDIPETCAVNPVELVDRITNIAAAISQLAEEARDAILASECESEDGNPSAPLHTGKLAAKQIAIGAMAESIDSITDHLIQLSELGSIKSAPSIPH